MSILQALILGIVQGVTEFLPISSSGHLVLGKHLLGVATGGATFEVFAHFGTLLAILIVFRVRIGKLITSPVRGRVLLTGARRVEFTDPNLRLLLLILLGSVPAGVLGLLLGRSIENLFNSTLIASSALILTGALLFSTRFSASERRELRVADSLIIGLAQGISLLPGISRSGATISSGLLSGVDGEIAAEYSFLLAVPAILATTLLKFGQVTSHHAWRGEGLPTLVGAVSAFVIGYLALRLLLRIVKGGRLSGFCYYCWAVGIVGIVFSLVQALA